MKKVRLILSASMLTLMGFSTLTMTSCTSDPVECEAGFTGKDCNDQIRTPMLGNYAADNDVNDADGSSIAPYTPVIGKNTTVANVNISNFWGLFTNDEIVIANVKENGDNITFTIPSQKPDGAYKVEGSGEFNASRKEITIHYSITNTEGKINNYTGTWVKK